MLANDPGPGISAWPIEDNMLNLEAQIQGPQDSPYEGGVYTLNIQMSDRYPLEPPRVRFLTPIYHPNIDSDGRICLDTLKMQPQGTWSPSININTLLLTIRVLMAQPNADDGLVPDITEEYKRDPSLWRRKAEQHTRSHAVHKALPAAATDTADKGQGEDWGGRGKQASAQEAASESGGEGEARQERGASPSPAEQDSGPQPQPQPQPAGQEVKHDGEGGEQEEWDDDDDDDDEEEDEGEDGEEEEEEEEEEVVASAFADAPATKKTRVL